LASAFAPPRRSDRKSGSADNRQPILNYCVRILRYSDLYAVALFPEN